MQNEPFLRYLQQAKPKQRAELIERCTTDQLKCITECCHCILNAVIPTTTEEKKQLGPHADAVRQLAKKGVTHKKKKAILLQQKGGFLGFLLGPILALARQLLE